MEKLVAKCSFDTCNNPAEWVMGTWQCCDKCAETYIIVTDNDWGYSRWGTSRRIGQEAILAHNVRYDLKHNLMKEMV
jgi:hypothetical protein